MVTKYVYAFGGGSADGSQHMKELLGGKGANLAEMTNAGVPVPPGFTISTVVCNCYRQAGKFPLDAIKQIDRQTALLERRMGGKLGEGDRPLLVSVRSGAAISMPGMMDTVLNLGLNDKCVKALAALSGRPRFAYDAYRRLIQMYGDVVLGVAHAEFEKILKRHRRSNHASSDADLDARALKQVVRDYKALIRTKTGKSFPQSPRKQLRGAIEAVFSSWNNARAIRYRKLNHIADEIGTACNVQAMVFGNRGENSATGVGFTRNPATGAKEFYGEFLVNAQGEDVVAGIRTPRPLGELAQVMPKAYRQLKKIAMRLERRYGDMQDFEFTIDAGHLYMLQTRTGKRTGMAAVRIATEMVTERLINKKAALLRVDPTQLSQLLHPVFDPAQSGKHPVVAIGLAASPGAACGRIALTADAAEAQAKRGQAVVLVRHETSPDDIHGMASSRGMLTAAGGMTSHAAVVGRQMGKPAVVGCEALHIDMRKRSLRIGSKRASEGDWISIDGTSGQVMLAEVPTVPSEIVQVARGQLSPEKSELYQAFATLLDWADDARRLRVRANADKGEDASMAVAFGAEGIGLCRTEHMFFGEDRIARMRAMILARTPAQRRAALKKLLPLQRSDFVELFKVMGGRPVTIRTLDPPLHEFLPSAGDLRVEIEVMKATGKTRGKNKAKLAELEELYQRVTELAEFNPMLGWRGCRLALVYPEIAEMQARAILEAAAKCIKQGIDVRPEIMIPLVGHVEELRRQRQVVVATAERVMTEKKMRFPYTVGTMIEVPRGALTAGEIAEVAEFFSFGTNDLTQTTFGFSRDDAGKFLVHYVDTGILERDPFVSIDTVGVGKLMRIAVEQGRATRRGLKIGICGEHGGEPLSVTFCHEIGLDYVSCSPYRIPVARLAAAQAALREAAVKRMAAKSNGARSKLRRSGRVRARA